MIYKCDNCKNRDNCPEKQQGYKNLCRDAEALNKMHYPNAYYTLTVKCDYWLEDKETYNDVGNVPETNVGKKGGGEECI